MERTAANAEGSQGTLRIALFPQQKNPPSKILVREFEMHKPEMSNLFTLTISLRAFSKFKCDCNFGACRSWNLPCKLRTRVESH